MIAPRSSTEPVEPVGVVSAPPGLGAERLVRRVSRQNLQATQDGGVWMERIQWRIRESMDRKMNGVAERWVLGSQRRSSGRWILRFCEVTLHFDTFC